MTLHTGLSFAAVHDIGSLNNMDFVMHDRTGNFIAGGENGFKGLFTAGGFYRKV